MSYGESLKNRLDASDYYVKLGSAMVGIALPGVGYDTYRSVCSILKSLLFNGIICRLWETLTLGAVAVVEKGIGLDKTVIVSIYIIFFHDNKLYRLRQRINFLFVSYLLASCGNFLH